MKKLLNVLFVTNELAYLTKDGENLAILIDDRIQARFPIHILEGVLCFSYNGASPAAIRLCCENGVSLAFMTPHGKFCGRMIGKTNGNVLLRREQYRMADDEERSFSVARNMILAKLVNSRNVLNRAVRDHSDRISLKTFDIAIKKLSSQIENFYNIENAESLRGVEGESARAYFSCFDDMILQNKSDFFFVERSKRPPMDNINAMISFFYSILTYETQSALESVGLDSYVGFFHTDRPGRASLALDLIEEFRAYLVDRFILTAVNRRMVDASCFEEKENGAVLLNDKGRKILLDAWQKRKQEEINHPFLEEPIKIGLIPYAQALLLSRFIRGDLDEYPPFFSGA